MDRVAEVLAALRKEQQTLLQELSRVERAIAALEEVMGPGVGVRADPAALPPPPAPAPAPKPYADRDFYEATAEYLASAGEPRTVRQIADALLAGGFRTRAKNFAASVRTMLSRAGEREGLRQTEDDTRWYVQR